MIFFNVDERISVVHKRYSVFFSFGTMLGFSFCFLFCMGNDCVWGRGFSDGLIEDVNQTSIPTPSSGATWRDASEERAIDSANDSDSLPVKSNNGNETFTGPKTTRFSYELNQLPSQDGQFWIVYDVSPYTERFANLAEPQNSIVDWIMFDSGKDFWRKEPFCVLSASRERLYVYHNANVQRYVSNIVDRFIDPSKQDVSFSIKVIALQSPEWRLKELQKLSPTSVSIDGTGADVQGWLTEHENMAKITANLERRSDYVLLNGTQKSTPNGKTYGWTSAAPQKIFARDYQLDANSANGYSADKSVVDEGYRIETTPLLSTTGETVEVGFRYNATVVQKTKTFSMRVPTASAPRQQLEVQRPEIVSCDFRGRIAVPRSKAAIVDLGMVPLNLTKKANETSGTGFMESVSNIVSSKSAYYNVLILIDSDN